MRMLCSRSARTVQINQKCLFAVEHSNNKPAAVHPEACHNRSGSGAERTEPSSSRSRDSLGGRPESQRARPLLPRRGNEASHVL